MQKLILLLLSLSLLSCKQSKTEEAPQRFTATFKTTKGSFDVEVKKQWSPQAANRFYNLIKTGYYDDTVFYRVVPGFVAQFGAVDSVKVNEWKALKVADEEVRYSNKKGTLAFARMGKESRGFDIFINQRDNTYLDTLNFEGVKGYPAFGNVIKGMDVVHKLYDGYGETTMEEGRLFAKKQLMLRAYPRLDIIVEAYIASEE